MKGRVARKDTQNLFLGRGLVGKPIQPSTTGLVGDRLQIKLIKMKNIFRHGDIPIYEGEFSVDGLKKLTHKGDFAFAFGETTGHRHRVLVKDPKDLDVFEIEGGFIMTLRTEADVVHEEHKTLKLTPGTYRFGKEREKDWFSLSVRRVID